MLCVPLKFTKGSFIPQGTLLAIERMLCVPLKFTKGSIIPQGIVLAIERMFCVPLKFTKGTGHSVGHRTHALCSFEISHKTCKN
jgi:hypothetical protein